MPLTPTQYNNRTKHTKESIMVRPARVAPEWTSEQKDARNTKRRLAKKARRINRNKRR